MTKAQKEEQELDLIKAAIEQFPTGASLEDIKAQSKISWNEQPYSGDCQNWRRNSRLFV